MQRTIPTRSLKPSRHHVVKSSQHAAIGLIGDRTIREFEGNFNQCGLDDGSQPGGEILSIPGLGSTTPLSTSFRTLEEYGFAS
jgi:hypothetical protein